MTMRSLISIIVIAGLAHAFSLDSRGSNFRPPACAGNSANYRHQWCEYDIYTDYNWISPDTGVTREYWLEITDLIVAPDGFEREGQAVNGTIPGPPVVANWGDNVIVHVANRLKNSNNGTSIHFHGIRQNFTNPRDGVTSITECPAPPGSSVTYKFKATQYGTSWYHSHFALQTYDGVFGPVIVHGPASANYDEDLGVIILNDWSHPTVHHLLPGEEIHGPPTLDNGLINGTNVFGLDDEDGQTGKRYELRLEENKTYRFRFVNGAMDSLFRLSIDHHMMTVISVDFVPVKPYKTDSINLAIGQRIDFLITTDKADIASSFWLRTTPLATCSKVRNHENVKGIIYYGDSKLKPITKGVSYREHCLDEPPSNLIPVVPWDVDKNVSTYIFENATLVRGSMAHAAKWYLNSTTMVVDWNDPSLLKIDNGANFNKSNAVIHIPEANTWTCINIETAHNISHPIHLHGYDFHVLAQGQGSYTPDIPLQLINPARRDTAVLPANGYLIIAFYSNNPGVWLMHCHIGWHAAEGFSLQFIVREEEISSLISNEERQNLNDQCEKWRAHTNNQAMFQEDSGI